MEKILTAYYKSPAGYAEITANERAILSVSLVDRPRKKPATDLKKLENGAILKQCIRELDEYFAGKRKHFSVKLEKHGTDFQKKVWSALEKIPYGETVSYEEVAVKIGNKKAVRAVGLANGRNPHWIIVPCHRVIGKNKKLVGYAGGLDVKQWLLEHERKISSLQ